MPKMKTNSGAKKRVQFTATGRLKRQKAYHSHILTKKSQKRKRNLRQNTTVADPDFKRMKRLVSA